MADQDPDRPSFSSFWKKSKEALSGKQITFVPGATGPSSSSPGNGDEGLNLSAKDKAQLRRAQVRKAQVQHRQRKANYIKQLELDAVRFRDLISQTARDTKALRRENEAIRTRLKQAGVGQPSLQQQQSLPSLSLPPPRQQQLRLQMNMEEIETQPYDHVNFPPPSAATELFSNISIDDVTVTLSMDELLEAPCFQVSSSGSSAGSQSMGSPATSEGYVPLSPEQENLAINFILSLEHICWDHFRANDFPQHGDDSGSESGHALMASTLCMSSAPDSVYEAKKALKRTSFSSKSASPVISWQGTGLNLQALYGLASSLVPGDKELTPVQAWFEMAGQHHVGLLLSPRVLEALKKEFKGVVKCLHFGAVIEREAFESVLGRVVGQELASPGLAF